jgi:hypothetical protein
VSKICVAIDVTNNNILALFSSIEKVGEIDNVNKVEIIRVRISKIGLEIILGARQTATKNTSAKSN